MPGPGPLALPICRAFNNSSHSSRLEAMLELDATQFLNTLKESNTPTSSGSIGSPVSRSSPTTSPSACSSRNAATVQVSMRTLHIGWRNLRASWTSWPAL